jgi:fucose 4-O-acetylase-like acetyltransferase
MTPARLAFIDWMKAIGMFLIVFGHVVGGPVNALTPPIYQKQLGVAFFLFVTGFTLARETRPARRVVINRLFEILLIGGAFAVIVSLASLAGGGRGQLSNYLPLLLGANVLVDNFPANPTTWYIGTYTHVILLWAAGVRRLQVTPALLAVAVAAEILIRAALWSTAGTFVAYMAFPNWMTVWLMGLYAGRTAGPTSPPAWTTAAAAVAVAAPLAVALVWPFDDGFPFRALPAAGPWSHVIASAGVSCWYAGATWLAYRLTAQLTRSRAVEFLAAQTVVVFVVHMPLYLWLYPHVAAWSFWPRALLMMGVNWIGLSYAGALLYRVIRPAQWRERVARLAA